MTDHECKHEVDLALMADRQKRILLAQESIQATLDKIDMTINGNGKDGLKTRISKAHTKLNIQWSLFVVMFGLIAWVLRS